MSGPAVTVRPPGYRTGRPPRAFKQVRVGVRLDLDVRDEMEQRAAAAGQPLATYLAQALTTLARGRRRL